MSGLSVPQLTDDCDTYTAALAYAKHHWYVVPVEPETKRPARLLGNRWQEKSSRDAETIAEWFIGTPLALGLHVGRSGAVVFDVDEPSLMPEALALAIEALAPPHQSTRTDAPGRGHYPFLVPPGRQLGNSRGELRDSDGSGGHRWGEVRGTSGLIVVEPSEHTKPGGRYRWLRHGEVPMLPDALGAMLPEGESSDDAADDATVAAFVAEHTGASDPALLRVVLERFADEAANGSRHDALTVYAPWAMREARMGLYSAQAAVDGMWGVFRDLMATPGATGTGRTVSAASSRAEYNGVLAWAVAKALRIDVATRKVETQERLAKAATSTPGQGGVSLGMAPPALVEQHKQAAAAAPKWPGAYFPSREEGLDVALLADDVLAQGPLAWGGDGRFWSYSSGVWRSDPDVVEGRVVGLLGGRFRTAHASNCERVVRHRVPALSFDPVPAWMNFANGLLDWHTGTLHPHSPDVHTTIQMPVAWDAGATCPAFDRFLASVLEPETVALVWEMIGYLMFSGNPLQVAFLLSGSGQNGKGTLLRVVEALLGKANVANLSLDDMNGNRFAPAGLYGKIANIAGDIDATFQESTAAFKKLTGEDVFRTEHKYGQPFSFTNWAVPVFSANKIPGSADVTEGYTRRWVIVPFNVKVTEADKVLGLSDLLMAELPGIAARAVPALREVLARRRFERRGAVAQAHEAFVEGIDRVRQWVTEATIPAPGHREPRSAVYQSFKVWAENNGTAKMSAPELAERLASIGHPKKRIKGTDYIEGLRVMVLAMRGSGEYVDPAEDPLARAGLHGPARSA